ncbi:uncharacterized protein L969DRAFT_89018 [Mixia osmundae IAM 14324]|uniref:DNA primase large subunit n=1 Tax=Mixia osmundae (strain CBS 9802 / IAM 14324 / JCM 22182 / KY 12970) TaxID=764103 RepID=G7E805_MIXOS|nr:uncharacterized protein L969DRAFT_89018 [Mixia osmundae IAM 14324]KEI38564.1 hypothetical protein L969DRAFT_89018 [Mixia osmundae IAM 14324]GAA98965.1 hypothetical protein E5Q_05653 [Mixia osmundae IAM 14324]
MFRTQDRAVLGAKSLNTSSDALSSRNGVKQEAYDGVKPTGGAVYRSKQYPFRLSFYRKPPTQEVTIEEFECWAIDRLKVLAEIEAQSSRNRSYDDLNKIILARAKQYLPLSSSYVPTTSRSAFKNGLPLPGTPEHAIESERRKDHYSHFVLRLAFCRSDELRTRFVRAEASLFRARFDSDDAQERQQFINSLNMEWQTVSMEEKLDIAEHLIAVHSHLRTHEDVRAEQFFKVPWTKVASLVGMRRIYIKRGEAYVPARDQASLVLEEFQRELAHNLEMTARAVPRLDEDDRLLPVLEHLSMSFLAGMTSEYTSMRKDEDGNAITADMIDDLAKRHFPLCMRNLHSVLREKKHLRHHARQQYNLFLKGVGLSVDEAIVFWRRSFTSMSADKFDKEHKYNIRHNYGLEGKRMNYPPKDCQRIISSDQPGPQDSHGCPFRHFAEPSLSSALGSTYRITNAVDLREILELAKTGHPHVACTRVFEITHGIKKGEGIGQSASVSHPNKYFDRSMELEKASEDPANAQQGMKKIKTDPAPPDARPSVKSELQSEPKSELIEASMDVDVTA